MYWDRFDICEAYWCFLTDWNKDGLTRRCDRRNAHDERKDRGIGVQLHRMQFRPAPSLSADLIEENGREIYDALVAKYHPEAN